MNETKGLNQKELYDTKKQEKEKEIKSFQRKKLVKRGVLWVLVILAVGGALFGLIKLGGSSSSNQAIIINSAVLPSDLAKGNENSKVILIEYSDFQCPACKAYHPLVKKLIQDYGSDFQFVYRHFPLPQHANAKNAAYAAEAAGKQGKFWEMHDMIFENQARWSEARNAKDMFLGYASSLNLDIERFGKDRDSQAVKDKVEKDYSGGVSNKVNATPTFFLNGKRVQPQNYEEFADLIKQANENL